MDDDVMEYLNTDDVKSEGKSATDTNSPVDQDQAHSGSLNDQSATEQPIPAEKIIQKPKEKLNPKELELFIRREKENIRLTQRQQQEQAKLLTNMILRRQFKAVQVERKGDWGRFQNFAFTGEDLDKIAEKDESLVPIRLDLESDGYRLKDTFTWNLNGML
jgi:SNF5 / SMARCB1 / INI1